jgi:hypothetical protein
MEMRANTNLDYDIKKHQELAKNASLLVSAKVQEKETEKRKDLPLHPSEINFMLAMMEAVEKDQSTMSEQEITDAKATEVAVNLEGDLYSHWMGDLKKITEEIKKYKTLAKDHNQSPAEYLKYLMSKYSTLSAEGQAMESQQDGAVQADQGQTTSDSTNLQMKAQMVQGINSILSTLVNLLGRVTA